VKTVLLLCCFACTLEAADTSALKLVQTIPLPGVKGRFDHFAIDTKGQRLLVSNLPTAPGARTAFFTPDLDRLYLAVPRPRLPARRNPRLPAAIKPAKNRAKLQHAGRDAGAPSGWRCESANSG